ncbi:MAG: phosphoglycerate dehydrogenase [Rhodothermales bacterium]|nr:phosphoglycerate dehydrogenase [Rhodothermales bacterium]
MKVLISAPYMIPSVDRFRPLFEARGVDLVVPTVHERLEEADLLPIIHDVDGVICGDDRFTERVLRAAHRLRVISKWGTGIDSIDQAACARLGIAVCNTPNAFSEPVADSVLGYMLCFARQLPWMTDAMRQGVWEKIPGRALRECTLGVIGVGDVGKAVVRRAVAFGMPVLGCDIEPVDPAFVAATGIEMTDREDLLRRSDFVSLNTDLNPTSRHLMDADAFALMKPTAVLINTSRGPVVDEEALVAALLEGRLGGAALDVFEHEPLPSTSPLRQMDRVMLAPHNANSSPAAWEHVHRNTIDNLFAHLSTEAASAA